MAEEMGAQGLSAAVIAAAEADLAQQATRRAVSTLEQHALFAVGRLVASLPAGSIEEIIKLPKVTPIPRAPAHILGLVNLRGQALPVLDLRCFFGLEAVARDTEDDADDEVTQSGQRLLVTRHDTLRVGLLCDRVRGIVDVPTEELLSVERLANARLENVAFGCWDAPEALVTVLNLRALLDASAARATT